MCFRLSFALFILLSICTSAAVNAQRTFYVSSMGNDLNDGSSEATAWQTIAKINSFNFEPGDKVFFKGGETFTGNIVLTSEDAGTASNPVVFGTLGTVRAEINAGTGKGFLAYNVAGIEVRDLVFTGAEPPSGTPNGVDFYIDQFAGTSLEYIVIHNVEASGFKGAGIIISTDGTSSYGYSNITITKGVAHDNAYAGLVISGKFTEFTHSNIKIAYCKMYNNKGNYNITTENSGNGMRISSVADVLIEYCETYGNGINSNYAYAGPMGIFVYNAKNAIIQYCESHHNQTNTSHDGGGFSIDGGSVDCVLQYNYSHDNDGSGFAMYQFANATVYENNIIRYNISRNDGRKNSYGALSFWGADGGHRVQNCDIYNNTFYLDNVGVIWGKPTAIHIIWNFFSGIRIRNNIFYIGPGVNMATTTPPEPGGPLVYPISTNEVLLQNNNYYSTATTTPFHWNGVEYPDYESWKAATGQETEGGRSVDPLLENPGRGGIIAPASGGELGSLIGYKLKEGSPMIDAGIDLIQLGLNVGSGDFYGGIVPSGAKMDIGAHEYQVPIVTPVTLISFVATKSDSRVTLTWKTADEVDVKHYEVEKSTDGVYFQLAGTVRASQLFQYHFIDNNLTGQTTYYRLKIVDIDGSFTYSTVLKVQDKPQDDATVYYSKGSGLEITIGSNKEKWASISFYDAAGRQVKAVREKLYTGVNKIMLRDVNSWSSGVYRVVIENDKRTVLTFLK